MLDLKTAIGISLSNESRWIVEPANEALYYVKDKTEIVDYFNNNLDFKTMYKLGKRYVATSDDMSLFNFIPKTGLWTYCCDEDNNCTLELATRVTREGLIVNNKSAVYRFSEYSFKVLTPDEVENIVKGVLDFIK